MRIAVPYENGNIFQHFGRSEAFKFYDVADGAVTAAAVVSTNGSGHGALAGFLVANHADVVICGGLLYWLASLTPLKKYMLRDRDDLEIV